MEKKYGGKIILILFLAATFLLSFNVLEDPDTGFHLATGRYIAQEKTVPLYDVFSSTAQGTRLIAHYWLADLIFYVVYAGSGAWGLVTFVAVLALLSYGLVLDIIRRRGGLSLFTYVILIPFVYFTLALWIVRPQVFSYVLVVFLIWMLERWRASKNNRWLWILPPLFLLWANTHAAVVLGLAIVGLYMLNLVAREWRSGKKLLLPLGISALGALLTLVNPNGYATLIYSSIIASPVRDLQIMEWKSLWVYIGGTRQKIFLAMMIAAVAAVWGSAVARHKKRWQEFDWVALGLVMGAFILPLISIRHVGFFPLIAAPFAVSALRWLVKRYSRGEDMIPGLGVMVGGLAMMAVIGGIMHVRGASVWNAHALPIQAADFVEKNNLQGQMLNTMETGGYLIWRLWPQRLVFIDGRSEVYGGTPIHDFLYMLTLQERWREVLEKLYNVEYVVLQYREWNSPSINMTIETFARALEKDAGFKLVFWDDAAVIMVKEGKLNKKVVDAYAYEVISPFKDPRQIPSRDWKRAEYELDRALNETTSSELIREYAIQFLLKQKEGV